MLDKYEEAIDWADKALSKDPNHLIILTCKSTLIFNS